MLYAARNCTTEWAFSSGTHYPNPFEDVQLDVVITDPDDRTQVVPAFWAGEQTWRVRFASANLGTHRYRTVCSDPGNGDLHGREGVIEVMPYQGHNLLFRHGPLRVAAETEETGKAERRRLEHQDGTPFFWLADTWWMGFCRRLKWPEDFQELAADRVAKGFTVVQIVAGLYPDMEPFDPRGANEAGFPWQEDFSQINPAYFDMVDLRLAHLVRAGLVPCLVGSWGFFMEFAGLELLKRHWRYLVARYGAYPVVWCAAGEALMPYYLHGELPASSTDRPRYSENPEAWQSSMQADWSELLRTIRSTDPYGHPLTIHPTRYGRRQVDDPGLLDFEMLQTGHGGYVSLADTVNILEESLAAEPRMPVLVAEVNYEGILESSREEMQRFLFWTAMLSGAAGHTYGANGLWQVNTPDEPYGLSPHGTAWGNLPWADAARLPGSAQIGLAKRLLERYPWWQFESHPEWVEPHQDGVHRMSIYAAGIPGWVRILFIPAEAIWKVWNGQVTVKGLKAGAEYRAFFFNPKDGAEHDLGTVQGDSGEDFVLPKPPVFQDWVLVLERSGPVD